MPKEMISTSDVKKISEMVNTYIKDEEKVTVEEYIGDSWRNILSMHLCAIQKDEFESSKDDQEQLKKFVIESFKIVLDYELLDKDGVDVDLPGDKIKKTLDHITLGIKVHSVSKHDIVNTLDLKKLLR
ncbi:unnamed protein product [Rhizophagus irregularis]|uniref:Uncharacterized protein n=1 Tax=Rhizophagus irregularis TaxID=588596 RepID=A0A916E1C1_9GLOM|nr:unnamed protein product [Rhizophagus irregularis]